jgi:two-component system, cell cycle response regulator DivK
MAQNKQSSEPGGAPRRRKILIVEDNQLNMKLFHDLLTAHGYDTLQTSNGMEALALARDHHPDLILMDIQLPEISGLEVTRLLKQDESLKCIPVIAVTAFAMKGDKEKIRNGAVRTMLPNRYRSQIFYRWSNAICRDRRVQ